MQGPDVAIIKTEVFDVDALSHLLNCDGISTIDKNRLRAMKRAAQKGNQLRVAYLRGKHLKSEEFGRVTPEKGIGLAMVSRDQRNFLAQRYYFDLDMVNSQPIILEQICKTKGWACDKLTQFIAERDTRMAELHGDRNQAKQMVMTMMFGTLTLPEKHDFFNDLVLQLETITDNLYNSAPDEIKKIAKKHKKYNEKGSVCASVLQQEEFKCLTALDKILCREGRELAVLMHDGGYVRKLEGEEQLPADLIAKCEAFIKEQTGFAVKLKQKEMETSFAIDETNDDLIDPSILIDDKYAAERFCEIMGPNLVHSAGGIYVFNTSTGIWSNDENDVKTAIVHAGLVFKQMGPLGVKVFDCSGSIKPMNACFSYLTHILPKQDRYFLDRIESSKFKLLFADGIYDFKQDKFVPGFDPNIVFYNALPSKYSPEVQEDMDFVMQNLFVAPFSNSDTPAVFLHYIMRAIISDFRMKKFLIGIGGTNSGKGVLTALLRLAFGNNVTTFNGNSLLLRRGDSEAARELSWLYPIMNSRIAISSEMKMSESAVIDGNIIKSVVSGGDEITFRRIYKDEVVGVNTSMPIIFCNDLPKFSPADESVRERTIVITFDNSFVDHPDPNIPTQKQGDPTIKQTLQDPKYSAALFHIMRKEFNAWKTSGYKEIVLPPHMIQEKNDWVPLTDFGDLLNEKFEITRDPEHMVLFDDIYKEIIRTTGEGTYSKTKVGRELTRMGLLKLDKKDGRIKKVYRTGIRHDFMKHRSTAEED